MLAGIEGIIANLGLSFESIVLIIVGLGGIIWFAADVKQGAIVNMFIHGLFFIMMYESGRNWLPFLILMLIFLVISVLLLLPTLKASKEGGYV